MPKYRVYELAKIFDKSAEEIIEVLQKHHIEVTNRLNSVDEGAKKYWKMCLHRSLRKRKGRL